MVVSLKIETSSSTAANFTWSKETKVVKAAKGTGIGVAAWKSKFLPDFFGIGTQGLSDLDEIRVYYQGEDKNLKEVRGKKREQR